MPWQILFALLLAACAFGMAGAAWLIALDALKKAERVEERLGKILDVKLVLK